MSAVIERIECVGPDRKARRICFADDADSRVTSAAALKLLGVKVGDEVDQAELIRELAAHEPQLARERALQLLGYRERSVSELRQRLLDNGYPTLLVDAVVARFCEVELVDDRRFASAWVRSRASAGYGRRRIQRELAQKGVTDELAEAALNDELAGDELSRAQDALRGRRPRDPKDRERLVRRLVSRGFELRVALDAVAEDAGPD
ncbi:MAG: regulatory protein RecX [Coriobacteriia bacterium]